MPGDCVLIRNVCSKGKNKLDDKWKKYVYLVVEQPNKQIPVYVVKREHGRGATKMLHRNLLLPFMALPLIGVDSTVKPLNSSQPSPVEVKTVGDNLGSKQGSRDAVSTASDGGIKQAGLVVPRYVIPQRRSTLNPLAPPFTPRLTSRGRCGLETFHQGLGENLCGKLEVTGSVNSNLYFCVYDLNSFNYHCPGVSGFLIF